ncbi:MAG: NifB/NifX family molybdenum-iron cluster-binding protein [Candidatus Methanomethylophilaceae archaeon]|jgi:predicted Fe-Mo cluster-binding NifX family protein
MKVAVALDGDQVSGHFGHCERYGIYQVDDGLATHVETVPSPGHEPGKLPVFLAGHHVDLVIAGGMGPKAVELFREMGIEVLLGVSGSAAQVAETFASGKLKAGVSSCHH